MSSGVFISILIFYAILVGVNLPAPLAGLKFDSNEEVKLPYAPPGFVIPIVWFVLFTLLGIARHLLIEQGIATHQWWLFALAFLCASYAYYTLGLSQLTHISALWFGLIGNLVVIAVATLVVAKLLPLNRTAAFLTLPVIIWTAFATIIVIGQMKLEKLI